MISRTGTATYYWARLINGEIRRLQLDGNAVIDESPVFPEVTGRVRDVRVLKDGSIVALTDEGNVFHIAQ